jgi:hypothetical protein
MTATTYTLTDVEMDAVLCVWDEMSLRRDKIGADVDPFDMERDAGLNAYWSDHGVAGMRALAPGLGLWAEAVWLLLTEDQKDATVFDWELVPKLLDLVQWPADDSADPYAAPTFPSAEEALAILFPTPAEEG